MLLFYRASSSGDTLERLAQEGLTGASGDEGVTLWRSLEAVPDASEATILVVDGHQLSTPVPREKGAAVQVPSVPASALLNVEPYRPPEPVTAGGGYVACPLPTDVALLLIFRRGVWDLPKGTLDAGETVEACAAREVREEVGIDTLTVDRDLGTTQHGYPNGDTYAVKTTHWYLMHTPERSFRPQRAEGIRRVAPARWRVARRHIGYETLARHMAAVEATVREAVG